MSPATFQSGQRVRLAGARFAAGFVDGTVLDVRREIARVAIDDSIYTEALVYESLGGARATFRGSVVVLDSVEPIEETPADDLEDEDEPFEIDGVCTCGCGLSRSERRA